MHARFLTGGRLETPNFIYSSPNCSMDTTSTPPVILGIDPGTRYMGYAVMAGARLLAFGVATLRNGKRPYDVIGQARKVGLELIQQHGPDIVVIEEPLKIPTPRGSVLSVIAQEVHARADELGIKVLEISPQEARKALTGNPLADKIAVAEYLVANGFPQLRQKLPKRPARAALGLRAGDKYWLHAFDALALCASVTLEKHFLKVRVETRRTP